MNNQLTIVIPCKNEGKGIIKVLRLLQQQHLNCQIIIADSSTDETVKLLDDYKLVSPQLIKIINGGMPSVARNNGAKITKTPYILFLDADIYIQDCNLINQCLSTAINGDYDLVTCKFHTMECKYNWIYRVFDIIQWLSSKTKPFAIGGFMLFKTETFNKLGRFNEEDKIAEDYHISSKIKPHKFKITNDIIYTPGRRFAKKGFYYMMKLAWLSWLNRNNDNWFKKDYNYWK